MRLLADENVPAQVVTQLRTAGHDVAWEAELAPGAPDTDVRDRAIGEQRLLLTFDNGFGAMLLREKPADLPGAILVRGRHGPPRLLAEAIVSALAQDIAWHRHFSVMTPTGVRQIPL